MHTQEPTRICDVCDTELPVSKFSDNGHSVSFCCDYCQEVYDNYADKDPNEWITLEYSWQRPTKGKYINCYTGEIFQVRGFYHKVIGFAGTFHHKDQEQYWIGDLGDYDTLYQWYNQT